MNRLWSSIRFRMMQICVAFTLLISLGVSYSSYVAFEKEQRRGVIQSAEFNLNLVTSMIGQDVANLNTLANLCTTTTAAINYLSVANPTAKQRLDTYEKLQTLYANNRSASYVQRLLLTNGGDRLIQVGSSIVDGTAITPYNVLQFPFIDIVDSMHWQTITRDPFARPTFSAYIPLVQPVYSRGQVRCGTLYMSVSTEIITNRLLNYQLAEGDQLYVVLDAASWRIEGKTLTAESLDMSGSRAVDGIAIDRGTAVTDCTDTSGAHYMMVSCPVGDTGISLTHRFASSRFAVSPRDLLLRLLLSVLVVQALGLMIIVVLNHIIVKPINRLQERIADISSGNFIPDPSVEWNNELGDIGRGVNQLAVDVQTMMDNRVAAEQERQRLEYQILQSQISPHFIYNTLNSIKWMATLQNATGIVEMTGALSRLLKYLSKSSEDLITLREELSLLNDYCVIQQYRYGGAITMEVAPPQEQTLYDCLIPRFTLQPLVENAIFHGIEPNGGIGSIHIKIDDIENGELCILVEDNGIGMSAETIEAIFAPSDDKAKRKFRQIGVSNVNKCIQYAFGANYGVSVDSAPGKGTRMKVHIPKRISQRKEGDAL